MARYEVVTKYNLDGTNTYYVVDTSRWASSAPAPIVHEAVKSYYNSAQEQPGDNANRVRDALNTAS